MKLFFEGLHFHLFSFDLSKIISMVYTDAILHPTVTFLGTTLTVAFCKQR
jgi:hypothetical protein